MATVQIDILVVVTTHRALAKLRNFDYMLALLAFTNVVATKHSTVKGKKGKERGLFM